MSRNGNDDRRSLVVNIILAAFGLLWTAGAVITFAFMGGWHP